MLERDLQKESCSRSKIIVVNRSNKARSSLLKEPKTVNQSKGQKGGTAGVDDDGSQFLASRQSQKLKKKRKFTTLSTLDRPVLTSIHQFNSQ
jgi:hypothetical protein